MKIFSFFIAVIMNFVAVCLECVKIEPIYVEGTHYFIREQGNSENKLIQFQVEVMPNSIRKEKGALAFDIKLKNIKIVDKNSPIDIKDISIENRDSTHLALNRQPDDAWESDIIKIVIPKDQLVNSPFSIKIHNQFLLRINGKETNADSLLFHIIPALSISIPDNEREIHFGKIIYDNGLVRSQQKHTFHLDYQCITQAKLIVTSNTNYNLKDKQGNTMPFRLSLLINGNKEKIFSNNNEFIIPSNQNSFENRMEGKCYIKFATNKCPIAGKYNAQVTFTIEAE